MEKEEAAAIQENNPISFLSNNNNAATKEDYSPRKPPPPPSGGGSGNSDRLKRDEWSEGAVSSLLEAYEAKWVLRNRAKLKGHDWEDVAKNVSCRSNSTKSPKTQTQCKNKIESMKKRYRSESTTADSSSWPLFPRLDHLLRGSGPPPPLHLTHPPPVVPPLLHQQQVHVSPPLMLMAPPPQQQQLPQPQPPPPPTLPPSGTIAQNSQGSNGVDRLAKEDGVETKLPDDLSNRNNVTETDSSTPALYSHKERLKLKHMKTNLEKSKRRKRKEEWDIADSIRLLAEVVMRSEQARMDTMRELERMRAETEAKRVEMDLKKTEIIANTQLEIAKLFAAATKNVDSSLRIGRS